MPQKNQNAFTIVELIIVIVVIAILAGIVTIFYSGWRNDIASDQVKSDLTMARTAMQTKANAGSGFPTSLPADILSESQDSTLTYMLGNTQWYCIEGTNTSAPGVRFHVRPDVTGEVEGACPGSIPAEFLPASAQSVTLSGSTGTIAGTGSATDSDGNGTSAGVRAPADLALLNDTLYIGTYGSQVRLMNLSTNAITTIPVTDNRWNRTAIDIADNGTLYMATTSGSFRVRTLSPTGSVASFVGGGSDNDDNFYQAGSYTQARFDGIQGIAIDRSSGDVYISDAGTESRRLRVAKGGQVLDVAGNGTATFSNGTGAAAGFPSIGAITMGPDGAIYAIDSNRIRKITPSGVVTTIAGSGTVGFTNGQGTAAAFNNPLDLAVGADGNIYVADTGNHAVRVVTPTGNVTTLAGNGVAGFANGTGTTARFNAPESIVITPSNELLVADTGNNRVRKIIITTS